MSTLTEVKDTIEQVGEAFTAGKKDTDRKIDALTSRVEEIESRRNTPSKVGTTESKAGVDGYRVLEGPNGTKSYLVTGEQKLANVVGLQKKEPVSFERWLGALVLGSACSDAEAREYAQEAKSVATTTSGALVPEGFVPQWIDMARAQSVLSLSGMRTVTMTEGTLAYSHQTGDPTCAFRSTEGQSLTATDPTFALRTLTAKTIACRTQISLEASMDIPDIGRQISLAYARAMGAAIDLAGIRGTAPAPVGLQTLSGVGVVASGGSQSDYDKLVDAVTTFLVANNSLDQLTGIISHPNMLGRYNKIKTGISGDKTVLGKPPLIADVPWRATTNNDVFPASPQSYMIELGNFDDLVMGVRLNPSIRILDGTASMASNLLVEVIGVARVDIVAVRPASFVRLTGLTAS